MSGQDFLKWIAELTNDISAKDLFDWCRSGELPVSIVASVSSPGHPDIVFAGRIDPKKIDQKSVSKGFRPGHVPVALAATRGLLTKIDRHSVTQVAAPYTIPRTIGTMPPRPTKVAIVGCGSLGSQLALLLAAESNVFLNLVDADVLTVENIRRHALGTRYLGQNKASALSNELSLRFGSFYGETHAMDVEALLEKSPNAFDGVDLAIFATANDMVERRLNRRFRSAMKSLYLWVEPLDCGGHILLSVPGKPGCFECLYEHHATGLRNRANLLAPGQSVERTLQGCTGTFVPFGLSAAWAVCSEACELARTALWEESEPLLRTYVGSWKAASAQSLQQSERCMNLRKSSIDSVPDFGSSACTVCSSR